MWFCFISAKKALITLIYPTIFSPILNLVSLFQQNNFYRKGKSTYKIELTKLKPIYIIKNGNCSITEREKFNIWRESRGKRPLTYLTFANLSQSITFLWLLFCWPKQRKPHKVQKVLRASKSNNWSLGGNFIVKIFYFMNTFFIMVICFNRNEKLFLTLH